MQRTLFVVLCLFAASAFPAPSGPHPISLQVAATPVYPGDVIVVTGEQRFTDGQMRNLAFLLGGKAAEVEVASPDKVLVIAPDVPTGIQQFTIVKHDESSGRDIVEFSMPLAFQRAVDQVLTQATTALGTARSILELPSGTIEVPAEAGRTDASLTATLTQSLSQKRLFDLNVRSAVASSDIVLTIDIEGNVPSSIAVRLHLSADLLAATSSSARPEAFAYVDMCDDYDYAPLRADFNDETKDIVISIPASRFLPPPACQEAVVSALAAAISSIRSVTINVAVARTQQQVCGLFTTSGIQPSSSIVEVGPTDSVPVAATLAFNLPQRLVSPTIHTSGGVPIIGGRPYSGSHQAVDLRSSNGDPAVAAETGTITRVDTQLPTRRRGAAPRCCSTCPPLLTLSRGHFIEITHNDQNVTRYSHLLDPNSSEFISGQPVFRGEVFAKTDNSGITCAPHLHFSYYLCTEPVDPMPWLRQTAPNPDDYVQQLSVVTVVNGVSLQGTRRTISQASMFQYNASFDVPVTGLTAGSTAPLSIVVEGAVGGRIVLYRGTLRIRRNTPHVLRAEIRYSCNAPNSIAVVNADGSQALGVDAQATAAEQHCGFPGAMAPAPSLKNACLSKPVGYIAQPIVLTVNPVDPNETYIFETYGFFPPGCTFTVTIYVDGQLVRTIIRTLAVSSYPDSADVFAQYP